MHKKLLVLFAAVILVAGMSFAQTQTFNFDTTVQKYLEVNPAFLSVSRSMTLPGSGLGNVPVRSVFGGNGDAAYANCRFTVSLVGQNPASDGLPILARQEVNGNGYDRLQTIIQIRYYINLPWGSPGWEGYDMDFLSDPEGAATGTWTNQNASFASVPHDGEIYMEAQFGSGLPHKSPDFGPDNTWNQSADAGLYTCTIVATYTVI